MSKQLSELEPTLQYHLTIVKKRKVYLHDPVVAYLAKTEPQPAIRQELEEIEAMAASSEDEEMKEMAQDDARYVARTLLVSHVDVLLAPLV